MTPARQLIEHCPAEGRYGDCHRTCFAVILDLPPEAVPNFYRGENYERPLVAEYEQRAWLAERGLGIATFAFPGDMSDLAGLLLMTASWAHDVPLILGGTSSLGSNHSVVIMNGAIVCDPSGNGIVGPLDCDQWQVSVLGVGLAWNGRTEPAHPDLVETP